MFILCLFFSGTRSLSAVANVHYKLQNHTPPRIALFTQSRTRTMGSLHFPSETKISISDWKWRNFLSIYTDIREWQPSLFLSVFDVYRVDFLCVLFICSPRFYGVLHSILIPSEDSSESGCYVFARDSRTTHIFDVEICSHMGIFVSTCVSSRESVVGITPFMYQFSNYFHKLFIINLSSAHIQ